MVGWFYNWAPLLCGAGSLAENAYGGSSVVLFLQGIFSVFSCPAVAVLAEESVQRRRSPTVRACC
jgi:hypothetical protein